MVFEADPSASRDDVVNASKNGGDNITDSRNGVTTPRVNATGAIGSVGGGGGGTDFPAGYTSWAPGLFLFQASSLDER